MKRSSIWATLAGCLLLANTSFADNVTLRDKIGQMLIFGFDGPEINDKSKIVKEIRENNIGGVILFDYNFKTGTYAKNIISPDQVRNLNHDLQNYTHAANITNKRPDLPLLISVDYEGGQITRLNERYGFPPIPSPAAVGKMTLQDAHKIAGQMADVLYATGFNLDFAPLLDVNANPENPVIGKLERSFSADPMQVANYGAAYAEEFLRGGVECAYKHFPGHGSSSGDSHEGLVDVTNSWTADELTPWELLLHDETGCKMVMTAHIVNRKLDNSGLPATLSHAILTDLLRKQMHYNGVIITDDMQMKAITDHYGLGDAVTLAINAGADMMIFGNQLTPVAANANDIIDIIEARVQTGKISKARIDEAYQHILSLKQGMLNKE